MRPVFLRLCSVAMILAWAPAIYGAQTPAFFENFENVANVLNMTPYYGKTPLKKVKVAVFDRGFAGYAKALGLALPEDTVFHPGPLGLPQGVAESDHGTAMAELVSVLMTANGQAPQWAPELHLYNVYGYTNFKAAVDDAIARHVDVILHSEVWEYGDNFDGGGFFNKEVSRATAAGILWINAAGNFARGTFNGTVVTGADGWVSLPDAGSSLELECKAPGGRTCPLRVVLSWNDFKSDVNLGTDKNLDLFLYDKTSNLVASSQLKQTAKPGPAPDGYSKYPREILEGALQPGVYFIKVKNAGGGFASSDHFRVSVSGDFVALDRYDPRENLLNPADNPSVITVGATDSPYSSVSFALGKPELMAPSSVKTGEGREYRGSSDSAAFVAAGAALLRGLMPGLSRDGLLKLTSRPENVTVISGIPTKLLGIEGTGPDGCFEPLSGLVSGQWPRDFYDGITVETTSGPKLMTRFDPILLTQGQKRNSPDDAVVGGPSGYRVVSRAQASGNEAFQIPPDAKVCGISTPRVYGRGIIGMMQPFRMPGVE